MPESHHQINNGQPEPQQLHTPTSQTIEASSSVQEIISRKPGYLVRKGTNIVFAILCLIVAGMWFIKYPDILEGQLVLTTDPLPIKLKSQTGGRLFRLLVKDNELLSEHQPIAELENTTGFENAILLEGIADTVLKALQRNDIAQLNGIAHTEYQSLGEAQGIYNTLVDAVDAYVLQHTQRIYAKRSSNLQTQIRSYQTLSSITSKEQKMIDEELAQADERFKSNEQLYKDKVISRQEYHEEAARLRQKKLALENQRRAGVQNNIAIAGNDKQMLDMRYEQEEKENEQSMAIRTQIRNLQNFVQTWKQKYLLFAPYDGKVHFSRPLQINENIDAGEEVFAIVPTHFHNIAFVNLPIQGTGKIQAGQTAHLLLDQFPYNEYGYLKGTVGSISALPQVGKGSAYYRISITLPDSLVTSYHRPVPFKAEMTGTARIITKDRNLLRRLISGFAKLDK